MFTLALGQAVPIRIDPWITMRYNPLTVISLPSYLAASDRTVQTGTAFAEAVHALSPAEASGLKHAASKTAIVIVDLIVDTPRAETPDSPRWDRPCKCSLRAADSPGDPLGTSGMP